MMLTVHSQMNGKNTIMPNFTCSACKAKCDLSVLFMSTCWHFYSCICASCLLQKERAEPVECTECMGIIEIDDLPLIFMKPV